MRAGASGYIGRFMTGRLGDGPASGQPDAGQAALVGAAERAWRRLVPGAAGPSQVSIVEVSDKSAVFRLTGVGPGGSAVIAKRCRAATAMIERTIYKEILPQLPVSTIACYGVAPDQETAFAWLFIEDLGDAQLLEDGHRVMAARWLGEMHVAAATLGDTARLPGRDPAYFFSRLRGVRRFLLAKATGPWLSVHERRVLDAVKAQCDVLETHWEEIEAFIEGMPRTLVHGDFVALNLRLRQNAAGPTLVAFDWEKAGWGTPLIDLVDVDLPSYWRVVKGWWPQLSIADVEKSARYAVIFGALNQEWTRKPMRKIAKRRKRMARALAALGWVDEPQRGDGWTAEESQRESCQANRPCQLPRPGVLTTKDEGP